MEKLKEINTSLFRKNDIFRILDQIDVNQALSSLQEGSLEITLTVP